MKKKILWYVITMSIFGVVQISFAAKLTPKEQLGKIMYQDKDFSFNSTQSCQTCHHRSAGFADPTNARDPYFTVVSTGADGESLGGRNAPTSSYTGYSPILHFDEEKNEYVGGMFWDGRATGQRLNDPLAEQALGPPTNPAEMGMADPSAVVEVVRSSDYTHLFQLVYGPNSLDDLDPNSDEDELAIYDLIGDAIAAYERSSEVQQFTSRYDTGALSASEERGMALFMEKCNACHAVQYTLPDGGTVDLFTSYSYANIGIPANDIVPLIEPDKGLGYTTGNDEQKGKFKIPTLRNVAATAPYGHNGYFSDLKSIVSFKNSRPDMDLVPPEVAENISPLIGDMKMSDADVDDVVQFLMTLTDQ